MNVQGSLLTQIILHSVRCYPEEACGIVTYDRDTVRRGKVWPVANIYNALNREDPENFPRNNLTAFYMDPRQVKEIYEYCEEFNHTVVCFYHSHTDSPPSFSEYDRIHGRTINRELKGHDFSHLVVGVNEGLYRGHHVFKYNPALDDFKLTYAEVADGSKEKGPGGGAPGEHCPGSQKQTEPGQ